MRLYPSYLLSSTPSFQAVLINFVGTNGLKLIVSSHVQCLANERHNEKTILNATLIYNRDSEEGKVRIK